MCFVTVPVIFLPRLQFYHKSKEKKILSVPLCQIIIFKALKEGKEITDCHFIAHNKGIAVVTCIDL